MKNHIARTLTFGFVFTGSALHAQSSDSAPTNPVARLPAIIVTATRTAEATPALPYSVDVVDAANLERKLPRTTPEALRDLPSVMLQKTSHGQGSPFLRGFTGFRTLMLVDGVRLNNSTFRDGPNQYWSTVDALALERLEVVRGPGSVLYGSDAVGGTVNALSRGREDYSDGFVWDRRTFYRFGSAERSHTARAEVSGQYDREFGFHAGVSWKDFGDLQGGEDVGRQRESGYDELDWDTKLEYFVTPNSRLVYGHQSVDMNDAGRTHSTIYGVSWSGTTVGTDLRRHFDQGRQLDYLQYHAQELDGLVEELHLNLSYHLQDEVEDRVRGNGRREVQGVDVQTLGITAQLQSPSPVGRWIYGAEYYRDWVDSSYRGYDAAGNLTAVRVQGPVADDATYDLLGVYVEDQLPLADERLKLILGGRYTYAQLDANRVLDPDTLQTISMEDSWHNVVGNARLLGYLDAEEHVMLYAAASQSFRAPNLSDLTRFDPDAGQQEIPASGLHPETFLSVETGIKAQFDRFTAEATFFHTFMDDIVVRVPNGDVSPNGDLIVSKENSGKGHVLGVELAAAAKLHRDWTLWANFTWMDGELERPITAGGAQLTQPVSRLMPTTVNSGLRWDAPEGRGWVEFATTFAAKQDQLASNDLLDTQRIPPGGTPGYGVYHLRAGWHPCANATISAAIENLTNEDYRIHGSGLNEPGRNFIVAADFRF